MKKFLMGLFCLAVGAVVMPWRMNTVCAEESYTPAPEEYYVDEDGVFGENGYYQREEEWVVTDENMQPITKLELHVGETKELNVYYKEDDGSFGETSIWRGEWITESGSSLDDLTSAYDSDLADTWYSDIEDCTTLYVKGLQETGEQMLLVTLLETLGDTAIVRIPVTVLPAEEGVIYPEDESKTVFSTLEEMYAAIRKNEREHKNEDYTLWILSELGEEFEQPTQGYLGGVCGFYTDQGQYAPYEGDYMMYSGYGFSAENLGSTEYNYKGKKYLAVEVSRSAYIYNTTCEQERWVDEKIAEICGEVGELGAYRNASDYEKVMACVNYIQNHVSYIGTTDGFYHTAYSALHEGKATCEGYSLLLYRLLREFGIQNRILSTVDTEAAHGFNIVLLEGNYYYCDVLSNVILKGRQNVTHAQFDTLYSSNEFANAILNRISQTDYEPNSNYSESLVEQNGRYYFYENGVMVTSKEAYVDGAWRWFDADGSMAVSKDVYQHSSGGKWVRYNEQGEMIKGEDELHGGWYYFEPITGTMMKGPVILPDGRKVFYDTINGQMLRGEHTINGITFAFDENDGHLVSGPQTGFWINADGKEFWYEDWQRQGWEPANEAYRGKEIYDAATDAWYWLDNVQHGAKAFSKDVYQESWAGAFGDNGEYGKWVRYDGQGHMIKGWQTTDAGTYYFDPITGAMVKGQLELDGTTYHFDEATGVMK